MERRENLQIDVMHRYPYPEWPQHVGPILEYLDSTSVSYSELTRLDELADNCEAFIFSVSMSEPRMRLPPLPPPPPRDAEAHPEIYNADGVRIPPPPPPPPPRCPRGDVKAAKQRLATEVRAYITWVRGRRGH